MGTQRTPLGTFLKCPSTAFGPAAQKFLLRGVDMRSVPSPVIHTPIHKTIRTNQRMLNAERLRATALLRERTSGFDKSENAIQLLTLRFVRGGVSGFRAFTTRPRIISSRPLRGAGRTSPNALRSRGTPSTTGHSFLESPLRKKTR